MNKPKEQLVIIGAGGHAKVCYDIAKLMNCWIDIIILDDKLHNDYFKISGQVNDSVNYIRNSDFFVAIGDNNTREKITTKLLDLRATFTTLVHPQSVIASDVAIGEGTVVMANVVINSGTEVGKGCILNTSSLIDHDNIIEHFVHVSPGAILSGTVAIRNNTWIGAGVVVSNNVSIGANIIIGAGSLILKNINEPGTYYGTPAILASKE